MGLLDSLKSFFGGKKADGDAQATAVEEPTAAPAETSAEEAEEAPAERQDETSEAGGDKQY